MTVPGKGGRPKSDRMKWTVMFKALPAEAERIRAAAEVNGESVAGMLLRLALAEADRVLGPAR